MLTPAEQLGKQLPAHTMLEDVSKSAAKGNLGSDLQDLIKFGNSSREYVLLHERALEEG